MCYKFILQADIIPVIFCSVMLNFSERKWCGVCHIKVLAPTTDLQTVSKFGEVNLTYAKEEWRLFGYFWQLNGALMNPSQQNRPFPSPQTPYPPLWPAALTLERNTLGSFAPHIPKKLPTPNSNMPTQKYIWHSCWTAGPFFGCASQVLSSRHSDGPYCTASQKDRQPSLWATDRPCLDWKDFDGAKQGGGGSCVGRGGFPAQRS